MKTRFEEPSVEIINLNDVEIVCTSQPNCVSGESQTKENFEP